MRCARLGERPGAGLVDLLPRLTSALAFTERSVAAVEGEELVVGIVPFTDVNGQRRPVAGSASLASEEVSELSIRVSVSVTGTQERHDSHSSKRSDIESRRTALLSRSVTPRSSARTLDRTATRVEPLLGMVGRARRARGPRPGRSALTVVAMGELEKQVVGAAAGCRCQRRVPACGRARFRPSRHRGSLTGDRGLHTRSRAAAKRRSSSDGSSSRSAPSARLSLG